MSWNKVGSELVCPFVWVLQRSADCVGRCTTQPLITDTRVDLSNEVFRSDEHHLAATILRSELRIIIPIYWVVL